MKFDKNDAIFCTAIGLRLRQERLLLEQGTAYVAQKLCISESLLIDIENGVTGKLTRDILFSLSDYYDTAEYELVVGSQAKAATLRMADKLESVINQNMESKDLALYLSTLISESVRFAYCTGVLGVYRDVCDRLNQNPDENMDAEMPADEELYILDHVCFGIK